MNRLTTAAKLETNYDQYDPSGQDSDIEGILPFVREYWHQLTELLIVPSAEFPLLDFWIRDHSWQHMGICIDIQPPAAQPVI
jgi:hypothetical protein